MYYSVFGGPVGVLVGGIVFFVEHAYDDYQNNPEKTWRKAENETKSSFNYDGYFIMNVFTR